MENAVRTTAAIRIITLRVKNLGRDITQVSFSIYEQLEASSSWSYSLITSRVVFGCPEDYLLNYPDVLDYIYRYYAYHAPLFAQYSSLEVYMDKFVLTPQFMQQMYAELVKKYPLYTAGVWQAPNDLDFLKNYIKASFARMQFHDNGYYEICNEKDVMVQQAYMIINADDYSKIVNGHF